jgi:hypothetical protein
VEVYVHRCVDIVKRYPYPALQIAQRECVLIVKIKRDLGKIMVTCFANGPGEKTGPAIEFAKLPRSVLARAGREDGQRTSLRCLPDNVMDVYLAFERLLIGAFRVAAIENQQLGVGAAIGHNLLHGADIDSGHVQVVAVCRVTKQIEAPIKDGVPGEMDQQRIGWIALSGQSLQTCQAHIAALSDDRFCFRKLAKRTHERFCQAKRVTFRVPESHLLRAVGSDKISVALLAHG